MQCVYLFIQYFRNIISYYIESFGYNFWFKIIAPVIHFN